VGNAHGVKEEKKEDSVLREKENACSAQ